MAAAFFASVSQPPTYHVVCRGEVRVRCSRREERNRQPFPFPTEAEQATRKDPRQGGDEMGLCSCCCRCLELLCSVLLPPLGVCLRHGCCSVGPAHLSPFPPWLHARSALSPVLLTILGYLPGVLYAIYVICSVDPDRRGRDPDDYNAPPIRHRPIVFCSGVLPPSLPTYACSPYFT
ncbi:hypothetical protein HU200_035503 [Digitaria exilis]|uniref:Uncharacterized protein n=1 Tax=Digitaria exilis TaxID=1010633 RepID=A0A835BRP7_9POAL|nr:hypothetical protein HU200_035503 [Digitaria exilis]